MTGTLTETFRTDGIARRRRLAFWNEVAASTFGDIAVDSLSRDFCGQLSRVRLRGLTLASVYSSPAQVNGVRAGYGSAEGWFLLLNEQGFSRIQQAGRGVCLGPGELTALRADRRYRIEFSQPNKTLVLYVPGTADDVDLEGHVARRHGPRDVPLLIALLRQFEALDPAAELPCADRLAVDVARVCWPAPARARRRPMLYWVEQICSHVERHLDEPDLDAGSIARRFGVSVRFVHLVFAHTGRTASSFIRERRLTQVASQLLTGRGASISQLALEAGFSDLSYFCRCFRRRFGVSARDYRRASRLR